jgi:mannan endo-1,4-beta-mannosidase
MIGRARLTRGIAAYVLGLLTLGLAATACGAGTAQSAPGNTAPTALPPTGPTAAPPPASTARVAPLSALIYPTGKFFGLEINGAPDSLSPVLNVAASVGRNPNLLGQYVAWGASFDAAAASKSLSYGALYYAAWEPFTTTAAAIASGASDAYITKFAQAVRAFGKPVALSFGHEMNGNWYPWGTAQTSAAEFVAAWRHVHDLFAAAGAGNVIWVWNPNIVNPVPSVQLKPYWPGSAYVDWVGITGYFATTGADTFSGVYGPTMTEIRQFTRKPFIIAETSVETGPGEVASVHSLIAGVEEHSDVVGLIWFNYDKAGVDWTLDGRPVVRAAAAGSLAGMKLVTVPAS